MNIRSKLTQVIAGQAALIAFIAFELLGLGVSTGELHVHRASGELHVSAPTLHFLSGKSLQRLRDGAVVPFDVQLTVSAGSKNIVVARALERFTISYDVWQEKFSVIRIRDFHKSNLNLTANAAEAWCLDNIFVSASGLPWDRQLWARLEVRSAEEAARPSSAKDPSISIATLIDIFSRNPRPQQEHWSLESVAFHLRDLSQ